MEENMYQMVVTDLDGTLLNSKKQISDRNETAIRNLQRKGVMVAAATGRLDVMTKPYLNQLKVIDVVIGCDGAVIRDVSTGTRISGIPLAESICLQAFEVLKHRGLPYYVFSEDELVGDDPENERLVIHRKFNRRLDAEDRIPIRIVKDLEEYVKHTQVYKIVASHEDKRFLDDAANELNIIEGLSAVRSGPRVLALKAKGISKASALKQLVNEWGIPLEKVAAFGDEVNDIDMLKAAGLGIAMGNADPEVKRYADCVTLSNDEDGVAVKIEELFGE